MKRNQKYILLGTQSCFVLATILFVSLSAYSEPTKQKNNTRSQASVYQQKCGFCHAPKPVTALTDMKAWVRLLYTSACPEVTITLNDADRKAIKAYLELESTKRKTDSKKDPEGSSK